jgi:murein peptide amidase A
MASITAMFATLAAAVVVGHSVDHRPIELVHVPGPGPRVLVVGCIHGNECAGLAVVRALRRAHPREDLWLVPTLNPDGLADGTRENANGVDLNRDFPSGSHPWSQPESRVARAIVARVRPSFTIWFHQHLDLVWAYGRSSAAGRRYAQLSGLRYYHHRWLSGTATNWQSHRAAGGASITVELPAGRLDRRALARQVRAVLRLALAAP